MAPATLTRLRAAFDALDTGPQATAVAHFFTGVPQPRPALLHPAAVPLTLALYAAVCGVLRAVCSARGTTGRSATFRAVALTHNTLLAVFSSVTAARVWALALAVHADGGLDGLYCTGMLWRAGLSRWAYVFYASKTWELVDTALLVWKNRTPSFLQVYHHAMTLAIAYLLQASQASATLLFVGLNAVVHSVMYTYYAATLLGLGARVRALKVAITALQIVQFVVGIAGAAPMFVLRDGACAIATQKVATGLCMAHAAFLVVLFVRFFRETYTRDGKKRKKL